MRRLFLPRFQPRSPLIYNLSGFYYTQKGDTEKAMSEYKKAADLDPDNFEAHFELGVLSRKQKDYLKSHKLGEFAEAK